ncbi:MAG: mechanosensitive ion channel [Bacteroidetes bacterium]|nr:MAG: mechanosensitive ion channel [Bacteroidota bacterium]
MKWSEFLSYELLKIGDWQLHVGNILMTVLVVVITWLFLNILRRVIERPKFILDNIDKKRRHSIYLIIKYFVWVISLVVILEVIGVKVTILLAGSAALLVGIGLGLQNIFADLVSGFFLLFEGTIKVGDVIEADGIIGKVVEINLRSSEVMTRDGVTIIVPNSKFVVEKVINWSHNNDSVRFNVELGVAYGSDVEDVIQCLTETLKKHPKVESKPVPFVRFVNFGESSLDFQLIFWTKETFLVENVKSDIRRSVYKELNERNIVIPFPQRDLHIKTGGDNLKG